MPQLGTHFFLQWCICTYVHTYENISWESLLICRAEMVSQDRNTLMQVILCDSSYLLPMSPVLPIVAISEEERRKRRLRVEEICFRNRIEWVILLPSCWQMRVGFWDPWSCYSISQEMIVKRQGYENILIRQEMFSNYIHESWQWEQEPVDHRRLFLLLIVKFPHQC